MKEMVLYIITIFITLIITASAIAMCPFSDKVYLSGAKVLDIQVIEGNPQNPNIKYTINNRLVLENYFEISEDETSCNNDQYQQASVFQVIVGSKATPLNRDGSLNLRDDRSGRNCILTVTAGPNQNLELVGGVAGGVNCTKNIQLDVPNEYRINPLRLNRSTGQGDDHIVWTPHLWPPVIGWGDTKHEIDADFVYNPKFSTP